MELFDRFGLAGGLRWLHVLAGITWIGLLYYFNFVQVPSFAAYADEARARNVSINILARRALDWFRWSALTHPGPRACSSPGRRRTTTRTSSIGPTACRSSSA